MNMYPKISAVALALAGIITLPASAADRVNLDVPSILSTNVAQTIISTNSYVEGASFTAANGNEIVRVQQTYQGIPVYGESFVATKDTLGVMSDFSGVAISGIESDVISVVPTLTEETAVSTLSTQWQHDLHQLANVKRKLVIWLDSDDTAHLAWQVSYVVYSSEPSRPMGFIDAYTGKLLDSWDAINFAEATGPGGNRKTGRYEFGPGKKYDAFEVRQSGSRCTLDSSNVETLDMNHRTSGGSVHGFTCPENTEREVNGAYSALNDAHAFGLITFDMYKEWYNIRPITQKLRLRVHYDKDYENAFWDGRQMTFGDGKNTFYPLVSLDVVAHEVSHGVTSQNSNLAYRNQSGGMNESFSDVSAAAALYYLEGSFNWKIGDRIKKGSGAMRYMDNPPLDGKSIGHADDYSNGMNVHYSSGVFNKAFYLLSNKPNWNIRKAFDTYIKANQVYWTANSTFDQGGSGVYKAAQALGYCVNDVVDAFAAVGVQTGAKSGTNCSPGDVVKANFTYTTTGLTATFTNTSENADTYSWELGDGNTARSKNVTHTYGADGTYSVKLTAIGNESNDSKTLQVTVSSDDKCVQSVESQTYPTWSASTSYKLGDKVSYNGNNYEATWWSTGARPDIYSNVWKKLTGNPPPPPPKCGPVANFTHSVSGLTVSVTDTSTNAVNRVWDFAGQATSTQKVASHTFSSAGTYNVGLTVTDEKGVSSKKSVAIKVGDDKPCDGEAWSASKIYLTGNVVSHNGGRYQAQWWTQGDEPGTTGRWGVWKELGGCAQ
ncbi:M4 family metallopeptidase [Veronia pacifica]|uniref:PKD domain-containing protein n=1 Tax=Veronia pacifica TaxID=1080227 RepID=A0A1C3EMK3_9GAMM|nr:M4 family metallopeptidase [Veronia pacifica]ODA34483.1 hypothetical protein A8L45_05795 [Veronia pacifica]